MVIATVSAVVGIVLAFVSMLQGTELTLRYIASWGTIVCALIFLVSFMSLGTKTRS